MKNYIWFLSFCLILSSCAPSANSTPSPTEPVVNFPTVSPDTLPVCTTADLGISSNSTPNSNNLVIGVTFTNKTKTACALSNFPVININDDSGKPLAIRIKNDKSVQTINQPTLIGLAPSDNIILSMSWQNYCLQAPIKTITLQIELAKGKTIEATVNIAGPPACVSRKDPSVLNITPYSYPP